MARKTSAGILLYRQRERILEVFLVHPGGPFWANKDEGAWSIPKGEYVEGEDPLTVAKREFFEETGSEVGGPFLPLAPLTQPGGKVITAWATEGNIDSEQYLLHGMATEIGTTQHVSGGRPCPLVRRCHGTEETSCRAAGLY